MVSILRFINDNGNLISFFIWTNLLNFKSEILARERVSHFEWIDNNEIAQKLEFYLNIHFNN